MHLIRDLSCWGKTKSSFTRIDVILFVKVLLCPSSSHICFLHICRKLFVNCCIYSYFNLYSFLNICWHSVQQAFHVLMCAPCIKPITSPLCSLNKLYLYNWLLIPVAVCSPKIYLSLSKLWHSWLVRSCLLITGHLKILLQSKLHCLWTKINSMDSHGSMDPQNEWCH